MVVSALNFCNDLIGAFFFMAVVLMNVFALFKFYLMNNAFLYRVQTKGYQAFLIKVLHLFCISIIYKPVYNQFQMLPLQKQDPPALQTHPQ